jgi:hypothetical protein
MLAELGAGWRLAGITGDEIAAILEQAAGAGDQEPQPHRGQRLSALVLPTGAERRRENTNATRAAIKRVLSCCDVPAAGKTRGECLYETAARASEVPALDVQDLDPGSTPRPDPLQGAATPNVSTGAPAPHSK